MQQQITDITAKLFRYFNTQFKSVDQRLRDQDKHIEGLYRLIDMYVKQSESQQVDALAGNVRLERLEQRMARIGRQTRARAMQ